MGKANQGRFARNEGVLNQDQTLKDRDESLVERDKRDLAHGTHGDPLSGAPGHPVEEDRSDDSRGMIPREEERDEERD